MEVMFPWGLNSVNYESGCLVVHVLSIDYQVIVLFAFPLINAFCMYL